MNLKRKSLDWIILQLVQARPVVEILNDIRRTHFDDFSWTFGGCYAFAEVLNDAIPCSELWCVATKDLYDWSSQHAFVKYKNRFYDSEGLNSKVNLLLRYGSINGKNKLMKVHDEEDFEEELWYPDQEFVTEEEKAIIKSEFLKLIEKNNRHDIIE